MEEPFDDAQGEQVYLIRQVVAALRAGGIEAGVVRMFGGMETEWVITLPGVHFLTAESAPRVHAPQRSAEQAGQAESAEKKLDEGDGLSDRVE